MVWWRVSEETNFNSREMKRGIDNYPLQCMEELHTCIYSLSTAIVTSAVGEGYGCGSLERMFYNIIHVFLDLVLLSILVIVELLLNNANLELHQDV